MIYLKHQSELKNIDIIDILDLKPMIGSKFSLAKPMTGRVMAKVSDVVMASPQEWRTGGQTSKAQRRKNFEEHGRERGRRQKE